MDGMDIIENIWKNNKGKKWKNNKKNRDEFIKNKFQRPT